MKFTFLIAFAILYKGSFASEEVDIQSSTTTSALNLRTKPIVLDSLSTIFKNITNLNLESSNSSNTNYSAKFVPSLFLGSIDENDSQNITVVSLPPDIPLVTEQDGIEDVHTATANPKLINSTTVNPGINSSNNATTEISSQTLHIDDPSPLNNSEPFQNKDGNLSSQTLHKRIMDVDDPSVGHSSKAFQDDTKELSSQTLHKRIMNVDEPSIGHGSNIFKDDAKEISSQALHKRIMDLNDQSSVVRNSEAFQDDETNSWIPLLPSNNFDPLRSTPSNRIPLNTIPVVESSLKPFPEEIPENSITKEPVTQYYFDLPTAIPTKQIGPLFDASYILKNHHLGIIPTSVVEQPRFSKVESSTLKPKTVTENVDTVPLMGNRDITNIQPTRVMHESLPTQTVNSAQETRNNLTQNTHMLSLDTSESVTHISTTQELGEFIPTGSTEPTFINTQDEHDLLEKSIFTASNNVSSDLSPDQNSSVSTEQGFEDGRLPELSEFTPEAPTFGENEETNSRPPAEESTSSVNFKDLPKNEADEKNITYVRPVTAKPKMGVEGKTTLDTTEESSSSDDEANGNSTTISISTETSSNPTTLSPVVSSTHPTSGITKAEGTYATTGLETTMKVSTEAEESDTESHFEETTTGVQTKVTSEEPHGEEKHVKENEGKVVVVVSKTTDDNQRLNFTDVQDNSTNQTDPSPFIKGAVSYGVQEFCKHRQNIETLLSQWINAHLANDSGGSTYGVEIFYQPDCRNVENLYVEDQGSPELENRTTFYFYVKEGGRVNANSTVLFPKTPTNLEISEELNYLKEKILHLELMNASSSDLIIEEETAVRTSIVVIAIVTSLMVLVVIAAVLVFFAVKRRRSSDVNHGRRCTPAANDAYSMDSVSVFYHSFRRKSRKRASNKSLKSYLNQGFDDPNGPSHPLNFTKLTRFICDNEAIHHEFSTIPSVVPKYDEMPRGVEDKNRYANVIPVPETRIFLGGGKLTPSAEYINANTIHGPKGELRYYVATQAPLENTVSEFWQMIWEQESKIIVMLTDFVEKGVEKCADYLPPSETLDCHRVYGEFQITLKSRDMRENYIVSMLQIKNLENNLVREIAHMWFTGWPHSGVPNEDKSFISFILDVRMTRKQLRAKGPIVVHCSPGTGRTGSYIASDLVMRQFDDQRVIDVPKTVFRIRRERAGAVQTKEQYAFIYRVVNLYMAKITTGNLDSF